MSGFDIAASPFIACFVIFRRDDKVAFVLRANTGWMNGYYGLPSGKVDKGEDYRTAAARECLEEVGVVVDPAHLKFVHVQHRHGPDMDWVDVYFEAPEWEGVLINAEPDDHSALEWLSLEALPENIVPPVAAVLQSIALGEMYSDSGWDKK